VGKRAHETAIHLGAGKLQAFFTYLGEIKFPVLVAIMCAFGRAFSEVGISFMLGGNIKFYTRNITTTIALETSKGNFALGLALGLVLLVISLGINVSAYSSSFKR